LDSISYNSNISCTKFNDCYNSEIVPQIYLDVFDLVVKFLSCYMSPRKFRKIFFFYFESFFRKSCFVSYETMSKL